MKSYVYQKVGEACLAVVRSFFVFLANEIGLQVERPAGQLSKLLISFQGLFYSSIFSPLRVGTRKLIWSF